MKKKLSYYGYKIGEEVQLTVKDVYERKSFDIGHKFTIVAFPPKVRILQDKHQYFVFGKDKDGNILRPLLTQIKKIKFK